MKSVTKYTLLLIIITAATALNTNQNHEILREIQAEKKYFKDTSKNVSDIVKKHIPEGISEEKAREILEKNGFKYKPRNQVHPKTAIGSNIDRHWTLLGLYYDETRVILHIEEEKVKEVEAWLFFDGL